MWYKTALEEIYNKLNKTSDIMRDQFPHVSIDGKYTYESKNPAWWTNGFWPGLLWMLYKDTKIEKYKEYAIGVEEKVDPVLRGFYGIDHDAGFQFHLTTVARYKILKEEESRTKGLIAASHLSGRFNPIGNYVRAWNWGGDKYNDPLTGFAIIDSMMNIPLLYWATEETNDPRFKNTAIKIADTVLKDFVGDKKYSHHIVEFNPWTGEKMKSHGGQGFDPQSMWSRGNAWCIYGMALSYKYTKDERYLECAKKVAKYFIENMKDSTVPVWDFKADEETLYAKDSSAGAIAASGMLEISHLSNDEESSFFYEQGEKILKNLYKHHCSLDDSNEAILLDGTVHFPQGSHINVPIIYGDFFFVEAIRKLNGKYDILW